MKKRTRSRILAMSIAGALVAGGCLPLIPLAVVKAQQSQAEAGALLDRGQTLLNQQQYQTAKQVLLSIDPSQLSSADQSRLSDLLKQADKSLAAQAQDSQIFDNAQTSLRDGHLAHAVSLYTTIINDPNASAELKSESQDNLLLAQAKQQELAPQMKDLLQQAIAAYNAGKLDEADQDLYQIRMTGSDLGADNGTPAQYQYLIAQKRVDLAQAALTAQEQKTAQEAAAQKTQEQTAEQQQAAQEQTAEQAAAAAAAQKAQQEQLAQQQQAQEQALEQKLAQQKAAQQAAAQQAVQEAAAQQAAQQKAAQQAAAQQAAQEAAAQQAAQEKAAQEAAQQQAAQEAAEEQAAEQAAAQQKAAQEAAQQQAAQEAAAQQAAQQKAAQEAAQEQGAEQAAAQQKAAQEAAQQQAAQEAAAQQTAQQKAAQEAAQEQAAEQAAAQQKAAQEAAQQQAAQEAAAQQTAQQKAAQEAAQEQTAEQAAQQQAAQEAAAQQAAQQKAAQEAAQEQAAQEAAAQQAAQQKAAQEAAQEQAAAQQKAAQQAAALKAQQEQAAEQTALQQQAVQQKLLAQQQAEDEQMEEARQTQAAQEAQVQAANEAAAQTTAQEESQPAPSVPVMQSLTSTPSTSAEVAPTSSTPQPSAIPTQEQLNQQRAAAIVAQADQAVRAARYQNAISLYNNALALDPQNEEAQSGLAYAEKLAGGQTPNLLTQTLGADTLAAQRNQVLFDNDMLQSTQALQNNDFATALNKANDALATAEASQQYVTQNQYQTLLNRAHQQVSLVQQQQAQYNAQQTTIQQQQALASQQQIEKQIAAQREQRINQLMGQATEYYKRMQYQQALDTLNQIVAIDPSNNTALFMQQMVQDQVQYQQWNTYHAERSSELQQQEVETEKELIPYYRLQVYPDDWPEISRLRESETSSSESPADQAVERALTENVPNITVNQQPFEDVINLLRQETGTNIVVNWNALANAGVQKQTPVSLTLQNVPFSKVLDLTLQQVQSSGGAQLGYSVDQGVLTISTTDELAQQSVIQVFDIQDLLVQAPNFAGSAPTFNLSSASSNQSVTASSTGGGGGGATSGNLFSGGGTNSANSTTNTTDQLTQITQLIENSVDRNSWVDNGGTVGTVRSLNGQLIINQTPSAMTKISNLLEQLREARSLEISIDTRFLIVDTSFLNDFGFSWSLSFNQGFFGNNIQPLSVGDNTATMAFPQATGVGNNIGSPFTSTNLNSQSALYVSGGILSNYQLSLILRATQEDENVTKLTAPRIMLFNGQHSFIAVTQQLAYVSSFTQTASSGGTFGTTSVAAVATNLVVNTLSTGVVLDVQATASADHRYVVMTIQPSLATLLSLQTFNVQGIPVGAGATNTNQLPGFVQLPDIQLTTLATTVSVPDDGTLLLGGQRISGETEIEAGVPVLSKIPFVNRLFTNRSFVRDNGILLILVHPQIIIQKEWEKNQFGQNY